MSVTTTKMAKRLSRPKQRRVSVRRRLLVEHLGERRVLASITGLVFEDVNHSFQQESGEVSAPGRLIYIDTNDNAQLDTGESFVVAEDDGTFEFANLADGSYLLRLFNGTQTQTQTFPVEATVDGGSVSVADANQLELLEGVNVALTADSVVLGDSDGSSRTVPVGNQLSKMEKLPDGNLLVVGTDTEGGTSWIVDPDSGSVTAVDLGGLGQNTPWADVAIDGNGRGVLLEQSDDATIVRTINTTGFGVQSTTTSNLVPSGTQVETSETGNRTVFAWSGTDGLQLSLWSNAESTFISSPIDVSGSTGLLAFDDASGLLALRTAGGGVSVHDVDANFATLHTLDNVTGPVAIDGARDLLLTISPVDAMLKVINVRDGALIADLAIDLSTIGEVASLAINDRADGVVVLGAAGLTEVALRKAAGKKITISDGQDQDSVLFGISLTGSNAAPTYGAPPSFSTDEDVSLTLAAPSALDGSSDEDGDHYVLVQRSQPAHGTAVFQIDGSLTYTPEPNFNGSDALVVLLHDGRDASQEFTLEFNITSQPDTPTGIGIKIDPVPETLEPGQPIGDIEIIDADGIGGGGHIIVVDDQRFAIEDGHIIFIRGPLDFEIEPEIEIGISITDQETNETIEETIAVTIRDENEPITAIFPHEAFVHEVEPGAFVAYLAVIDDDVNQSHTISVDDDRFEVDPLQDDALQLKAGVTVDYETEPVIVVNVTATELSGGNSFTQAIQIFVIDIPEQPLDIELSNDTVMELMPGDVVGEVSVDGGTPSQRFEMTVNDPRFEIDGSTLKLLDDVFVERASQAEIELTITVTDLQGEFASLSEDFVIQVLENLTPYHNLDNPYDVNHSGEVTAADALAVINYLNTFGPGPVGQGDTGFCYDVNADSMVTALDALLVLNELNRINNGGGGGTVGGEGEDRGNVTGDGEGERVSGDDTAGQPIAQNDRSGDRSRDPSRDRAVDDVSKEQVTVPSRKLVAGAGRESAGPSRDAIEIPAPSDSETFAENVDETLRLLSDKSS